MREEQVKRPTLSAVVFHLVNLAFCAYIGFLLWSIASGMEAIKSCTPTSDTRSLTNIVIVGRQPVVTPITQRRYSCPGGPDRWI
jgi:hypothetical protein